MAAGALESAAALPAKQRDHIGRRDGTLQIATSRKDSTPAASRIVPAAAYDSRPNEWAYEPTGNSPSLNCRQATNASTFMRAALSDGLKCGVTSFAMCADAVEQLGHGRIVGHQQPFARDCQREMQVTDFEGDPNRLLPVAGVESPEVARWQRPSSDTNRVQST